MHIADINIGPDWIECPFDGEKLEGLVSNNSNYSSGDDLLSLSNIYNNLSIIKCEGRIVYGKVEDENSNDIPISIEATGDIMSSSSRGNIDIKTITMIDNNNEEHEVISLNENTLIIPEPDDDGDDDYGVFYFLSRLN